MFTSNFHIKSPNIITKMFRSKYRDFVVVVYRNVRPKSLYWLCHSNVFVFHYQFCSDWHFFYCLFYNCFFCIVVIVNFCLVVIIRSVIVDDWCGPVCLFSYTPNALIFYEFTSSWIITNFFSSLSCWFCGMKCGCK